MQTTFNVAGYADLGLYGEYRIKSVKAPEGFAVENLGDKAILKYKDSMAEETVKVSVVLG